MQILSYAEQYEHTQMFLLICSKTLTQMHGTTSLSNHYSLQHAFCCYRVCALYLFVICQIETNITSTFRSSANKKKKNRSGLHVTERTNENERTEKSCFRCQTFRLWLFQFCFLVLFVPLSVQFLPSFGRIPFVVSNARLRIDCCGSLSFECRYDLSVCY